MPLLAGGLLGDASGNNVQDASANNVGEQSVNVVVSYGGFLMAERTQGPWQEILDFLNKLQDAIDLGEGFVTSAVLANLTNGIAQIIDDVAAVQTTVNLTDDRVYELTDEGTHDLQDVLDAIAAIEPGGGLTEAEHDHLLGLANLSAGAVWDHEIQFETPAQWYNDLPMWALMKYAAQAAFFQSLISGLPLPNSPHFRLSGDPQSISGLLDDARTADPQLDLPADPDLSEAIEGDTVLSFLQRTQPAFSWQVLSGHHYWDGGTVGAPVESGGNDAWIICTLRDLDIVSSQAGTIITGEDFLADAVNVPPVWPGEDNVDLGTPVALDTGITVEGPMDGVLISITGVDQYKTWYMYNTTKAYRHIGSLAFYADNGAIEQYQVVAFTSGVYTPLHMQNAAGVLIRTAAGTTGTATPWSRKVT